MTEYKWTPQNPNPRSVAKVGHPLPVPTCCPNCNGPVRIGTHAEVYDGRSFGVWPYVYLCEDRECDTYGGLHPFTHLPLGTLANKALRDARKRCKPAFEKLFKEHGMTRNDAYAWLAQTLGITAEQCHFALFDVEMCERAQAACKAHAALLRAK